jgi:hypothetical protein
MTDDCTFSSIVSAKILTLVLFVKLRLLRRWKVRLFRGVVVAPIQSIQPTFPKRDVSQVRIVAKKGATRPTWTICEVSFTEWALTIRRL